MALPLSSEDLRNLADALDKWNDVLIDKNGEYKKFAHYANSVVIQLDDCLGIPVAHLVFEAGWVGLEFDA